MQIILYNNINVFENQPTPFVSKDVEYIQAGERWGQRETWNLNGYLTGCNFSELNTLKNNLINNFSSLIGNSIKIGSEIEVSPVYLQEISFSDSEYYSTLNYSISLYSYPNDSFVSYGVLEPSDELNYQEDEEQVLTITRTVSAKGFCTSSLDKSDSAINNAINFVKSRLSLSPLPPLTIEGSFGEYYLESSNEEMDRVSNIYRVTQTFKSDLTNGENFINRYTIEQSRADDQSRSEELLKRSCQGKINAGRYSTVDIISKYKSFKNSIAGNFIIDERVSFDENINELTYSFSFYDESIDSIIPEIVDDFSITIQESSQSSLITMSVEGQISSNYGCIESRWQKIEDKLNSIINSKYHLSEMQSIYNNFYTTQAGSYSSKPQGINLNVKSINSSYSKNEKQLTASYSCSIDDRFTTISQSSVSEEIQIQKNYAVEAKVIKDHYDGGYYICQNLGYNYRESVSVSSSITYEQEQSSQNSLEYVRGVLNVSLSSSDRLYFEPVSIDLSKTQRSESCGISASYNNNQPIIF